MRVVMIECLSGEKVYEVGKEYSFPDDEAVRLVQKGIAKPKVKKTYEALLLKVEEKKESNLQKEKNAAAILYKEELEAERVKLQIRVDEISEQLKDKEAYSKSLILVEEKKVDEPGKGNE